MLTSDTDRHLELEARVNCAVADYKTIVLIADLWRYAEKLARQLNAEEADDD